MALCEPRCGHRRDACTTCRARVELLVVDAQVTVGSWSPRHPRRGPRRWPATRRCVATRAGPTGLGEVVCAEHLDGRRVEDLVPPVARVELSSSDPPKGNSGPVGSESRTSSETRTSSWPARVFGRLTIKRPRSRATSGRVRACPAEPEATVLKDYDQSVRGPHGSREVLRLSQVTCPGRCALSTRTRKPSSCTGGFLLRSALGRCVPTAGESVVPVAAPLVVERHPRAVGRRSAAPAPVGVVV